MKRLKPLKNAFAASFFILMILIVGCEIDSSTSQSEEGTSAAEAEYFADYEGPERKWGFLDKRGEVSIKAKFDLVSGFTEGLAAVNYRGRWGYINRDGRVIIPYRYLSAWPFVNGYARVSRFDGKQCIIDIDGNERCVHLARELGDCHNGLFRVVTDGGEGFANPSGDIVIDPVYQRVDNFQYGLAVVKLDGKEGAIDTTGQFVVPSEYDRVRVSSSSLVVVSDESGYRFWPLNNREAFSCDNTFESVKTVQNETAAVKADGGWVLIGPDCQRLTERPYQAILPAGEGRWIAKSETGYGLLDMWGKPISRFVYQQINKFHEGVAVYRKNNLCGFIDDQGNEITPPQFGLAWDFSEGLARAAFRDGIAYVDSTGDVPFIPEYYELRDYSEGLAPFQEN